MSRDETASVAGAFVRDRGRRRRRGRLGGDAPAADGLPRQVAQPDRPGRRRHHLLQHLRRPVRALPLDGRPERARRAPLRGSRAGRIRWARTSSAATRWPASSTGRASRSTSASSPSRSRSWAGSLFGMLAGYYRGIVDGTLMRLVDIMFSLPGIVLAIVIAGLLGPNRRNAMIAIGIVILPAFARVVRGAVLEVMGYPYTESARALGASGWRIMAASRDPEHRRAAARARDGLPLGRDPGRGGAELPRARHAAAGGIVGRHAQHGTDVHRPDAVALDLPRAPRSCSSCSASTCSATACATSSIHASARTSATFPPRNRTSCWTS